MRFGVDYEFWVVVDAKKTSVLEDVLFRASLRGLYQQFRGGLTPDDRPTLYTEYLEAKDEAETRLQRARRDGGNNGQ